MDSHDKKLLSALDLEHPVTFNNSHHLQHQETTSSSSSINKQSLKYIESTAIAGGIAGCSAKTLIAPLDRIKILYQTQNPQFKEFSKTHFGLIKAFRKIYSNDGFIGFFQGHSVTLIRIFPYASIKFVAYEQIRNILIPSQLYETNFRRLLAGSMSGIISVFFTYPLDLLRVRMAYNTNHNSKKLLIDTFNSIFKESAKYESSNFYLNKSLGITNFYRGFSSTIIGMIPYAGVSFWTHDFLHDIFRSSLFESIAVDYDSYLEKQHDLNDSNVTHHNLPPRPRLKAWAQLIAGGLAGLVSQTASYPFEVIRRRLQVGALIHNGEYFSMSQMAKLIYNERGLRGFYVGLSIGYIKVFPMVACSFFVYERMKFILGI